jgi:hypothetical protein
LLLFSPPRCITSKAKREEASPIHPGSALPEEKEKRRKRLAAEKRAEYHHIERVVVVWWIVWLDRLGGWA